MSFYVVTTTSGQVFREALNIKRATTAAGHEFPSGVLSVKHLAPNELEACELAGLTLPAAARTALVRLRASRKAEVLFRRAVARARRRQAARDEVKRVRDEARRAAAAEKERAKQEAAVAKRRETARLKRAETVAESVLAVGIEADEWDGEAVPWD